MSAIVWDDISDREYETGLDKGVLYPPADPAVPWNGLTSVVEKFDQERQPVYYDGRKINDLVILGDFEATMKAITFPDEFAELEGMAHSVPGMFLGNQKPTSFGLSYRTLIGDSTGNPVGYKLHILYNITAIPADRTYATQTDSPSLVEFEWELTGIPEEVPRFRPTAHIIVDSTEIDSELLGLLEDILYGTESTDPELPPMADLLIFLLSWFSVIVVDNGDGTWTAYSSQPDVIVPDSPDVGEFEITEVTGTYLDADTYQLDVS